MAAPTITQYGAGSQFIGSPAVYEIAPTGSGSDKPFYRMKLHVVVSGTTFDFSTPVEVVGGVAQPYLFDVSSALRAVAGQWEPTPDGLSYPAITFYMTAEEEWMTDGIISYSDTARYPGSSGTVTMYQGALTDRERLTSQRPARYSRKPATSPEICFFRPDGQGQPDGTSKHLMPGSTAAAPSVAAQSVPTGPLSGANIYGIPYPADGHEIRFINSLGVHENIFAAGLPSREANITTENYTISRQETLTQFSRGLAVKQNDYETWTFSSGPLDAAWASWYVHEFLMSSWAWINIGGAWIPCHVLPEETTVIIARDKAEMVEVLFRLQLDINGSPL